MSCHVRTAQTSAAAGRRMRLVADILRKLKSDTKVSQYSELVSIRILI